MQVHLCDGHQGRARESPVPELPTRPFRHRRSSQDSGAAAPAVGPPKNPAPRIDEQHDDEADQQPRGGRDEAQRAEALEDE